MLGYGRVGQAVAALAEEGRDRLACAGIDLRFTGALVRDAGKPRHGPRLALTETWGGLFAGADIAIEVLGGLEPARTLVTAALEAGVPVVTANKTLVASCGPELRALARSHATTLACEAAVVAGVPFVGALARRPFAADARRIEGIVNGTSHFIVSAMAEGSSFVDALQAATARGYAEPDSAADVTGRDAAEKLTILLQLCGCPDATTDALPRTGIDVLEAGDLGGARALGGVIKPVVIAAIDRPGRSGAWVGPAFVQADHPLARIDGVANAVEIAGPGERRATFAGPGAGPAITAATILDDVVEVATGAAGRPTCSAPASTSAADLGRPPRAGWFIRLAQAAALDTAHVIEFLAARTLSPVRIVRESDRIYLRTVPADWAALQAGVDALEALGLSPLALPVIDGGPS